MIKNLKYILTLSFLVSLFSYNVNAQVKKGDLVDGISAVVGNEIILESDVLEQQNYALQQGAAKTDKCEFMDGILSNKLLIYKAKKDTLIQDRTSAIKEQAADKYSQIVSQFPSERAMLDAYKFRTSYEMKNAIEKIDIDGYYSQQKYALITEKVNITPNEVTDFYNAFKFQLPQVKDEVVLSKIAMYPKLTEAHKDEIINKLKKIKQDILAGESFENKARIYSEDNPGSAANGGLYTNISRGKMVKIFEATALNLQEGEISDPVESEFGFHIIQLVKKSGKLYDARHILLKAEPNAQEIAIAKAEMEKIKEDIKSGKITFKDAAYKYSDDKNSKFNAGIIPAQDGSDRLEKIGLSATVAYQIAGLNKGDLTDVFMDEMNQRKVVTLMKVNDVIPQHSLDLNTDFERIKTFALEKKKGEVLEKWVKENLPDTFISINNRYKDCQFKTDWSKNAIIK